MGGVIMENEIQNSLAAEDNNAAIGFLGKLGNIFANPGKTFQSLDSKPTWLAPLLIIILLSIISTQFTFPLIMQTQLESFRSNPDISPEQLETIERQFTDEQMLQKSLMIGGQAIGIPVVFLILSGIFYLLGTVLLGGDSTFKKVFSVFIWSSLISTLGMIIKLPLVIAKSSVKISLSPALILSPDHIGGKLHTLLSSFDFFTIWFLAVFATGFGIIYKFSKQKAFVSIGVLWAVWIIISVVFSGFLKNFGM